MKNAEKTCSHIVSISRYLAWISRYEILSISFSPRRGAPLEIGWGALSHWEEPAEVAQASISDASGTPPCREETLRKTQDMLEWLCCSAGLGTPWDPPVRVEWSVRGKGSLGVPAQAAAPVTRPQGKTEEDGWMDGHFEKVFLFKPVLLL